MQQEFRSTRAKKRSSEEEAMTGFEPSLNMIPVLGILTGIVAILTPVAIVWIIFAFRQRRYAERQQTIRLAIEKGADLSPLLLAENAPLANAHPDDPRPYVLRGLLWGLPGIAIGVGVTWATIQHGARGITIIGWIPAAIGAAYLIFSRFVASRERDSGITTPRMTTPDPKGTE
jgi:hypothetical protein